MRRVVRDAYQVGQVRGAGSQWFGVEPDTVMRRAARAADGEADERQGQVDLLGWTSAW
jgi:hypothetical protein